jgi:hypothetical protein
MEARWFAFEVTAKDFPWAFCKKDPKRVIAALELLATIVCIMLFGRQGTFHGTLTGSTDNMSNTYAVKRLMSTCFPLTILLIELSDQLRTKGTALDLSWLQRDSNVPADDLTNLNFSKFSPANRIEVVPSELPFISLREIEVSSQQLYLQIGTEKEASRQAKLAGTITDRRKLSIKQRLRWSQPW